MGLDRVGDIPVSEVTDSFVSKDVGVVTKTNLDLSTANINNEKLSGKKQGSVVAFTDGTGAQGLAVARGSATDSGWDFFYGIVAAVSQADLADVDAEVNITGKFAGKQILAVGETAGYAIYIADAALPASIWYLPTGTATGAVTPS